MEYEVVRNVIIAVILGRNSLIKLIEKENIVND